jgi:serine/threonine-protein kinase
VSQKPAPGAKLAKGGTVTIGVSKGAQPTAVPDLVGQSSQQAVSILEAQGFKADVAQVPSDEPKGNVVAQHPKAGTKRPAGSGVRLNVSAGRPSVTETTTAETTTAETTTAETTTTPARTTVTIPDVVGTTFSAARAQIKGAGLVTEIHHVPSSEPKDTVVAQSPRAGTTAKRGDHVLLNLSLGKQTIAAAKLPVPSVLGETEGAARADLQAAGFTVAVVYQDTVDATEDGVVVDQTPTAGTSAAKKSKVTIYVGRLSG